MLQIGIMALVRQSYYKWWSKFDYKLILIKIQETIESFKKMEREYAPETTKLDLPSLTDLQNKFYSASLIELKAKLFALVQSQLDIDFSDCLKNIFSKSNYLMDEDSGAEEDFAQSNEDMKDYLDHLLDERVAKNTTTKDKGKAKA